MNQVFKDWQLENAKVIMSGVNRKNLVTAHGNLTDVGIMFLSKYGGRKSIMGILDKKMVLDDEKVRWNIQSQEMKLEPCGGKNYVSHAREHAVLGDGKQLNFDSK
jgi:hypothetical protein